jgi:hypothetical protein
MRCYPPQRRLRLRQHLPQRRLRSRWQVGSLSGGERGRVHLAKTLREGCAVLQSSTKHARTHTAVATTCPHSRPRRQSTSPPHVSTQRHHLTPRAQVQSAAARRALQRSRCRYAQVARGGTTPPHSLRASPRPLPPLRESRPPHQLHEAHYPCGTPPVPAVPSIRRSPILPAPPLSSRTTAGSSTACAPTPSPSNRTAASSSSRAPSPSTRRGETDTASRVGANDVS